jgi:eukaryotic-like serine/threonine-protein kinase
VSARARASRRREFTPEQRKIGLALLATAIATFLLGYAVTAISFRGGAAPADVVLVPDVRQRPIDEARRLMGDVDLGLLVGDSLPNPNVPQGSVIAQTPLPGYEVAPGTEVRVIVSTGSPRPTVPTVDAMPVPLATRALQAAGFDVEIAEGEGRLGRVLGTDPPAGTPLPLPATVRLIVGAGEAVLTVPDVVGLPEQAAIDAIEGAGFQVGQVVTGDSEEVPVGAVAGQSPDAGSQVPRGTAVDLRVNVPE